MSVDHLEIARLAAHEGGKALQKRLGNIGKLEFKGKIDLVSDADRDSEEALLTVLSKHSPDIHITSEEIENSHGRQKERWIVDPLDGTTNFVHSLPGYCVSIAYEFDGEIKAGVVFDPYHNEEFSAAEGKGAYLNGAHIFVSKVSKLNHALAVTGFPYESEDILDLVIEGVREMLINVQGLRRLGSAALDACYTANGRFDIFYEFMLQPWDIAAGTVILQEAGGQISSPFGESFDVETGDILVTNGLLHEQAVETLLRAKAQAEKL